MSPGEQAEKLVADFGITSPEDLDVEAFAFDARLEVEYQELQGCEATLVGYENRAIATVRPSTVLGRQRFSIAHELGHWMMHRGRSFRCRVDDPGDNLASNKDFEKHADEYASHLLMPRPIFQPMVKAIGKPGFRQVNDLAETFQSSRTATCIRLAQIDTLPIVVACYGEDGLRWHVRAPDVPKRWFLRGVLDDDSFAYELATSSGGEMKQGKQPAEVWFENSDASNFEVMEHCARGRQGEVLVLIYLVDAEMMDAGFDPDVGTRRYNELGSYVSRRS